MVSNILYILNNYLVSWFMLQATEVSLVRGVMQVILFGVILITREERLKSQVKDCNDIKKMKMTISLPEWTMISLYGLLMSSAGLSCLSAIPFMPIGDLIVLCFSAPVFSVFLESLFLRKQLHPLSLALCFLIGNKISSFRF